MSAAPTNEEVELPIPVVMTSPSMSVIDFANVLSPLAFELYIQGEPRFPFGTPPFN